MYEVVSSNDVELWNNLISESREKDIFFDINYLKPFEAHLNAKVHLFCIKDKESIVLYPFFKRLVASQTKLKNIANSQFYDIIAPWYYGGPLITSKKSLEKKLVEKFTKSFSEYCNKENIICEFSRIHPYLNNSKIYGDNYQTVKCNEIINYIDLNEDLSQIENGFGKSSRNAISKAKRENLEIIISESSKDLRKFHEIYIDSMNSKDSRNFYYFSYDFLMQMEKNLGNHLTMFVAKFNEDIIAASIFLNKYNKMYYYLSARDSKYSRLNASSLIINEAIKFGKENSFDFLDLGGGSKGSSLLRFKLSFSRKIKPLYLYKKVHNKEIYQKLCISKGIKKKNISFEESDFFPEYRIKD